MEGHRPGASNYPEVEASALDVLGSLDAICTADQKVGRVSVANWPDGKQAAVSLTFNDALASGYRKAAPDLELRGWLGTYFLTNFNLESQDKAPWNALASRGHEIGCHTVTHPNTGLPTSPPATIRYELNCGQFVTPAVTGGPILTFAYPDTLAGPRPGRCEGRSGTDTWRPDGARRATGNSSRRPARPRPISW